ncbi:MAG: NUDIX domain-containing protein [Patescibacteria group bacterium]
MAPHTTAIHTTSILAVDEEAHPGRFLALKRHPDKRHGGKWNIVSGKLEPKENVEKCVCREIREELGPNVVCTLIEAKRVRSYREDDGQVWIVNPTMCRISGDIVLNDENTEYRWVTLEEFLALDIVPPVIPDLHDFFPF